jgi:hypothetical protein
MHDRYEVLYLEDFIEPHDLAYFQKYCSEITEWSDISKEHYVGGMFSSNLESKPLYSILHGYELIKDNRIIEMFHKYVYKTANIIKEIYGLQMNIEKDFNCINCYKPGHALPLHGDEGWPGHVLTSPNGFTPITHGVIAYFNDVYTGGDLVVPWYNKRYKPKAGSLIIIPSGNGNEHLVEPVKSGERWIWSTFWAVKNDNIKTGSSI